MLLFFSSNISVSATNNPFNTSSVLCKTYSLSIVLGLFSLNLSNAKVSAVTNLEGTFYGCSGLTSLDVTNWELKENGLNRNTKKLKTPIVLA